MSSHTIIPAWLMRRSYSPRLKQQIASRLKQKRLPLGSKEIVLPNDRLEFGNNVLRFPQHRTLQKAVA